ncbi:MAG: hypothetical protein KKI08_07930, partial [Armatimonadetes bacterium]|nr:hypothetical protein [Armatimonadota bacterium]
MRRWQPGVVFALLCVAILPRAHTAPANTAAALSVQDAKGAQRLQSLGKAMLVEGYYVTDPVPMLVTDLQLMATNTILPADHYLVLSGPPPAGAQTGAKLRLSGVLRQPGGKDPAHLQSQTAVLQVATGASAQVLTPALSPSARVVRHVAPPSQPTFRLPDAASRFPAPDLPTKYAVIMNPGNSPDLGWRQRHLREAAAIRALLLSRDYRANAIFTLTGGGETTDRGQTRPATVANLRLLFDQLALMMRDNCQLVVYMTGLGGGFYDQQMGQEWESGSYGGVLDTNGD